MRPARGVIPDILFQLVVCVAQIRSAGSPVLHVLVYPVAPIIEIHVRPSPHPGVVDIVYPVPMAGMSMHAYAYPPMVRRVEEADGGGYPSVAGVYAVLARIGQDHDEVTSVHVSTSIW